MVRPLLYDTMGAVSMMYTCDECAATIDEFDLEPYQEWTGEPAACCPYCGSVELTERERWDQHFKVDDMA